MTRATPDCLELLEGLLKLNPNDRLRNVSRMFPLQFKGSRDPNHFISEINVGKRRNRHATTLKLNDEFPDRLKGSSEGNPFHF